MGFIYKFIYIFNNTTQKPIVWGKYVNYVKSKITLKKFKKSKRTYFSNTRYFFNILFFNLKNFKFTDSKISLKKKMLPFIIKHLPTIFFSFIDSFEVGRVAKKKKSFRLFKKIYKPFCVSSIFLKKHDNYYYFLFFNKFFFNTLSFFYFRATNFSNISNDKIALYFLLKFFINFRTNTTSIKFINVSTISKYKNLMFNYSIKDFSSTNRSTVFTYYNISKYLNSFYVYDLKNNFTDVYNFNSTNNFTTNVVNGFQSNPTAINFIKLNKIYNKGKFARNKQIYRTGVIWCLWLTVLTVCAPFYYFYSFNFIFTYLWLLFFFFIARFVFVFINKNNSVNYWKISSLLNFSFLNK